MSNQLRVYMKKVYIVYIVYHRAHTNDKTTAGYIAYHSSHTGDPTTADNMAYHA